MRRSVRSSAVSPHACARPPWRRRRRSRALTRTPPRSARRSAPPIATAFAELYGTNGNKRNAFGKCVSKKAKAKEHAADEQDAEDAAEFKNAAKECDAERGDTEATPAAFADKYGTNENKRNAFGKCVSSKASEGETESS